MVKCRVSKEIDNIPNYTCTYNEDYIETSKKKIKMETILELEKTINDYENYPRLNDLLQHINTIQFISYESLRKMCYMMENGFFDDYIVDYKLNHQKTDVEKYLDDFCEKYEFKKHKHNVKYIRWEKIYTTDGCLRYNLEDILLFEKNLPKYVNKKATRRDIMKDLNIQGVSDLIYNYKEGVFTEWLKLYQSDDYIYNHHIRKINYKQNCKNLDVIGLDDNGGIRHGRRYVSHSYNIQDIIKCKNELDNFKDYPTIQSFSTILGTDNISVLERIVWNVEEGTYDDLIDEYNTGSTSIDLNEYYNLTNVEEYRITGLSEGGLAKNGLLTGFNNRTCNVHDTFFKYRDAKGGEHTSRFSLEDVKRINLALRTCSEEYVTLRALNKLAPNIDYTTLKRVLKTLSTGRFNKYFV